jgi:3-oxoacyl-[acyl-carrier protein] reductase
LQQLCGNAMLFVVKRLECAMADYRDAVVVVTGASTGLGRAIAVGAAQAGARAVVINFAASTAEAQETARLVAAAGAEALLAQGDVGEDSDCRRIAAAADRFGRIDALFANAGTSRIASSRDLDALSADDFMGIYRTNVVGPYQMIRACRSLLEASERAAVVNTSSIAGITGGGSSLAYVASKGALNALTKGLARALAPKIRVNALCPGFIDSPWFDKLGYRGGAAALREHIAKTTPLRAASTPEDIAGSALFLGSPASRHVTGETLLVDAGLHLGG